MARTPPCRVSPGRCDQSQVHQKCAARKWVFGYALSSSYDSRSLNEEKIIKDATKFT